MNNPQLGDNVLIIGRRSKEELRQIANDSKDLAQIKYDLSIAIQELTLDQAKAMITLIKPDYLTTKDESHE